jgi:hypothetical protein
MINIALTTEFELLLEMRDDWCGSGHQVTTAGAVGGVAAVHRVGRD